METPLISICIPVYKRIESLKRLINSINTQKFRDFEVIITDDSPGNEVGELCKEYEPQLRLRYFKNQPALGTPENWNQGIRFAQGEWIKLMHDDDWFTDENSLQVFAEAIQRHPEKEFFFSAYRNVYQETGRSQDIYCDPFRWKLLNRNPASLLSSNIIGPPSVIMHRNNQEFWYDKKLKWLVDIEFYYRFVLEHRPVYIPRVIVNVGMHGDQVTASSFRVANVEIPEHFYFLEKIGSSSLRHLAFYDAWWRLMRNLNVKNDAQIRKSGYNGRIHPAISSMIAWQQNLPGNFLKWGVFSKLMMLANYFRNYHRLI